MSDALLRPLDQTPTFTVKGKHGEIVVEQDTGRLRGMSILRGKEKIDLFAQARGKNRGYIGGLRIYDELDRCWYDDFNSEPQVLNAVLSKRGDKLTLEKRYRGCPFHVKLEFAFRGAALDWNVTLMQDQEVNREVRVEFFVPLISGWMLWTAANCKADADAAGLNTPWPFDGMSSFEYMYNQGPYFADREVLLPVFSMYNAKLDAGLTFSEHIERNIPASKFQFSNADRAFNWGFQEQPHTQDLPYFEHVHYYIGMHGQKPCKTGGIIYFHGGHWRPGLGLVYKRYQEYFDPPVPAVWERAGVFECGSIFTADRVEDFKSFGGRYLEVHGHFPFYGDYFYTDSKVWHGIDYLEDKFLKRLDPKKKYLKLTRPLMVEKLKQLKEAGISNHLYLNYTDGFQPWIEKNFPDSICKYENGSYGPSGWRFCHCINPDPAFSYGKWAIKQIERAIKHYGDNLDGFFLDCFRHFELDFGHTDGVTMVNNKAAYSNNWALTRIQEKVGALFQKYNRDSFANKPRTIQNMRHVDAVLLEGHGDGAEVKFYFACIAKPIFFMWTGLSKPQEEFLKRSVIYGAWPRDPLFEGSTPEEREQSKRRWRALYAKYLPLYRLFKGRVLCFEPDPIDFSDGIYGQIYTLPDGSYIVGCMTDWISSNDTLRFEMPKELRFKLRGQEKLNEIFVFYPGDPNPHRVQAIDAGEWRVVPLEKFTCAAAIVIRQGGNAAARRRKSLRDRSDHCGDPVSAFEMGSGAAE